LHPFAVLEAEKASIEVLLRACNRLKIGFIFFEPD